LGGRQASASEIWAAKAIARGKKKETADIRYEAFKNQKCRYEPGGGEVQ